MEQAQGSDGRSAISEIDGDGKPLQSISSEAGA